MPDVQRLSEKFEPFRRWMQEAGLGVAAIEAFRHYYGELARGESGIILEQEIEPISVLPEAEDLSEFSDSGRQALRHTAILKLNGGLGTGMGLAKAKSLLPAKGDLTFLDILARQTLKLRSSFDTAVPLIFMNSHSTHADTLGALEDYPELSVGMPLAFVQNRVPKVLQSGLAPAESGPNDPLNWNPPGHGDLYVALQTSGMLDRLQKRGMRYLFVSNSDNLGATLDLSILGYFSSQRLPFMMEAAGRTEADKKGGHLARRKRDGRMLLRESAQTAPDDADAFQDVGRHRFFNTNNIWLNLDALVRELKAGDSVLKLPLIRNEKTLDPRDSDSPPVYQLETAMGSAIEVFEGAAAICVARSRFAPVKNTSDLLVIWSDAYDLTDEYNVVPSSQNRHGLPVVSLDQRHYKFVDEMEVRFPFGAPHLTQCRSLEVLGDVRFDRDVTVVDSARITNTSHMQAVVAAGTTITGDVRF